MIISATMVVTARSKQRQRVDTPRYDSGKVVFAVLIYTCFGIRVLSDIVSKMNVLPFRMVDNEFPGRFERADAVKPLFIEEVWRYRRLLVIPARRVVVAQKFLIRQSLRIFPLVRIL